MKKNAIFILFIFMAITSQAQAKDISEKINNVCEQKATKEYAGKNASYISMRKPAFMTICACQQESQEEGEEKSMTKIKESSGGYSSCIIDAVKNIAMKCLSEDSDRSAQFIQEFDEFMKATDNINRTIYCYKGDCGSMDEVSIIEAQTSYYENLLYTITSRACH